MEESGRARRRRVEVEILILMECRRRAYKMNVSLLHFTSYERSEYVGVDIIRGANVRGWCGDVAKEGTFRATGDEA